jgi:hypothetical protein
MSLTSVQGTFFEDTIVTATSGNSPFSSAYIDTVDSVNTATSTARLLVHQNEGTGFTQFGDQSNLTVQDGSGAQGTINSYIRGVVDPLSGDLLYIDNRAAVDRSAEQTEDLKIVIQL